MAVVGASVALDWVAPDADPAGPAGRLADRLSAAGDALQAPRLLFEEVGNALLGGCRRGRWSGAAADAAYRLLQRLPVQTLDLPDDRDRAWDLSRRYDDHPLYDMVYVALAERLGTQLVTADERLHDRLAHLGWVVVPD